MKIRMRPIGLAITILILAAGQTRAGNLIINGDFSVPDAGGNYTIVNAGDTSLTGWTVVSGSVETDSTLPVFGAPTASGNPQNLDLDGNNPGTMSQSFSTSVGQTYSLDFFYSNNIYGSGGAATVSVTGSSLSESISHSGATYGSLNWSSFAETFVATSTTATLTFASTDVPSSSTGILLDNVSVSAVPEPSSVILLGLGGLGLTARLLRRRK